MKKFFAIFAVGLTCLSSLALADKEPLGVQLRLGYYLGSSFRINTGGDGSLNGLQVGLDFPVARARGIEFSLSPSMVLGGAFAHGADTDGQIYKFMLGGRSWINKDLYVRGEVGFGHTEARNNTFKDVDDIVTGVSIGMRLNKTPGMVSRFIPTLEVGTYISRHRELNGIVFSLGFSF